MAAPKGNIKVSFMAGYDRCYAMINEGNNTMPIILSANENNAVKELALKLGKSFAIINYVLPDTLVTSEGMQIKGLEPQSRWGEMLRHRTIMKSGLDKDNVYYRQESKIIDKNLFATGYAVPAGRIKNIVDVFAEYGLALSSISPASSYVVEAISKNNGIENSGVYLYEDNFYSFVLYGEVDIPLLSISGLSGKGPKEHFMEIERKLRGITASGIEIKLDKFFIAASSENIAEVSKNEVLKRFNSEVVITGIKSGDGVKVPLSLYAGVGVL